MPPTSVVRALRIGVAKARLAAIKPKMSENLPTGRAWVAPARLIRNSRASELPRSRAIIVARGMALASSGLVNEKRCGADQFAIVDLSDDKIRDVSTADNSEPPVLGRSQDSVTASYWAICQQAWPYDGPIEPRRPNDPLLDVLVVIDAL